MTEGRLLCPRNASPLWRLTIGGIETDVCEDCGGLWLDRLELGRFQDQRNAFGDALVVHLRQFTPGLMDPSERLACPHHSDVTMMRRKFSPAFQVDIDECPECGGIWLDSGELAQLRS